jgi:hypothetical protein
MPALATVADVAARLGREITEAEEPRMEAILADVSAAVELYCGRTFNPVPPAVLAVVCQIAARTFGTTPEANGIMAETAGPFTVQYGATGAAGSVGMLTAEREVLERFRAKAGVGTVEISPWVM